MKIGTPVLVCTRGATAVFLFFVCAFKIRLLPIFRQNIRKCFAGGSGWIASVSCSVRLGVGSSKERFLSPVLAPRLSLSLLPVPRQDAKCEVDKVNYSQSRVLLGTNQYSGN